MKALVVYCHPYTNSFTAAVLGRVQEQLRDHEADVRVIDLYREEFDPRLCLDCWQSYEDTKINTQHIHSHSEALAWCDTLIFIYPTWWYGLPAMLKGWLDRVFVPGVSFHMPDAQNPNIRPALHNITRLGVFTTCGASRGLTFFVGSPGKKTILRGLRLLCHPQVRTSFAAHYLMDSSTDQSRAKHLGKVDRKLRRFLRPKRSDASQPSQTYGSMLGNGTKSAVGDA